MGFFTVYNDNGQRVANPKNDNVYRSHCHVEEDINSLCEELGFIPTVPIFGDLAWFHSKDQNLIVQLSEDKNTLKVSRGAKYHRIDFATYQEISEDLRFTNLLDFVEVVLSSIRNLYL